MKSNRLQLLLLMILTIALLGTLTHTISAQEFSAGAKLVGTSPFLFAEAKLWILSLELGAGLASNDSGDPEYGYETGPIDFS